MLRSQNKLWTNLQWKLKRRYEQFFEIKVVKINQKDGEEKTTDATEERDKKLAILETFVIRLRELLGDVIQDSMNRARKKETGPLEDVITDRPDFKETGEESDEDEPVYNPKNLPLGWDGK